MPSKRGWALTPSKEICNRVRSKIFKEKIKKSEKNEMSTLDLELMLRKWRDFIGVFPCDCLKLAPSKFRSTKFMIINLDSSESRGSHWICLRVDKMSIEIFDSLGYDYKIWGILPTPLIDFLASLQKTRRLIYSPVLQSKRDINCGLYCVFFVLYRQLYSFSDCLAVFSKILAFNHSILIHHLS